MRALLPRVANRERGRGRARSRRLDDENFTIQKASEYAHMRLLLLISSAVPVPGYRHLCTYAHAYGSGGNSEGARVNSGGTQ